MSLALAKKPSLDNVCKQKYGIIRGASKHHQTILNTLPASVVQRKPGCPCGGGCPRCKNNPTVRPKLKINELGNIYIYRQEANRIAEWTIRMPENIAVSGKRLLAHELVPVVQQRNGTAIQRKKDPKEPEIDETGPYSPGKVAERYQELPSKDRAEIDKAVNRIFTEQTGITRKLDPDDPADRPLIWKWLRIRDTVVANYHSSLEFLALRRYPGCRAGQNFYLDLAQSRAPRWVYRTIRDLEDLLRPQETITIAESTLNRFFKPPAGAKGTIGGRHKPGMIQKIIDRLRKMAKALGNLKLFRCVSRKKCGEENADKDPDAFAYAGAGTTISICPNFFNQSLTEQISTLIHESAHHIGLMRNVINRDAVIKLNLSQALTNAESYALLVIENFEGPPLPPSPEPPAPLTEKWSQAYMSSEVYFSKPVKGLFYEGKSRRKYLSDKNPTFAAPLFENKPIRFAGQIRFYVDTEDMPLPPAETIPKASVQILFTDEKDLTSGRYVHNDPKPEYMEPGLPLLISFLPDFDFTETKNGKLRFTFWLGGIDFYALYDDTVYVNPNSGI